MSAWNKQALFSPFAIVPVQPSKALPMMVYHHPSHNCGEVLRLGRSDPIQGTLPSREAKLSLQILGIHWKGRLALQHLTPLLKGHLIKVPSDNATVVYYLNHQGDTRCLAALKEANQIISCPVIYVVHRREQLQSGLSQPPLPESRGMGPTT